MLCIRVLKLATPCIATIDAGLCEQDAKRHAHAYMHSEAQYIIADTAAGGQEVDNSECTSTQ